MAGCLPAPPGTPGADGDDGATGPIGPSDAWVGVGAGPTSVSTTVTTVATSTVSTTGPVLLLGTLTVDGSGANALATTCFIAAPGGANLGQGLSQVGNAPSGQALRATIAVQATATVSSVPAAFTLRCSTGQLTVNVQNATLTAIRVGALH